MAAVLTFVLSINLTYADYSSWKHSGSVFIITTEEGADLPADALEKDFPLLVRLDKDWFDFSLTQAKGEDVRVADASGSPLAFQIEEWNAIEGHASIWISIPEIKGQARQEIKVFWGNAAAHNESNGKAVFNAENGFVTVQHLHESVDDVVGTVSAVDKGTTSSKGIIGSARNFTTQSGIFCGDRNKGFPTGSSPHTSQAWIRPDVPNGGVLGWGIEQRSGKVVMSYNSPSYMRMDCYFSGGSVKSQSPMSLGEWNHVVHTYEEGESRIYVNGKLDGKTVVKKGHMDIKPAARMYIGGWYNRYSFNGDIDEVRISSVTRSANWVKLEYENQKPLQTLVGPIVKPGSDFSLSTGRQIFLQEGKSEVVSSRAEGAQKLYWTLNKNSTSDEVIAVDRFSISLDAGRVEKKESWLLTLKAVYPDEIKFTEIPVVIEETIPEPQFTIIAPKKWDGRKPIEIAPRITNKKDMLAKGAGTLSYNWTLSGLATLSSTEPGKLLLTRAQNSGTLTVKLGISNGGAEVFSETTIEVKEPAKDKWVKRTPAADEKPVDGQFYGRNAKNEGTLFCNGVLDAPASRLTFKLFADDKLVKTLKQKPGKDNRYAFEWPLKPGLIIYRVELLAKSGESETLIHKAGNLVCGDAYIIEGQSNALATDTKEESPRTTSKWIRSYGYPEDVEKLGTNLWCNPVWKFERGQAGRESRVKNKAQLGWWGMELAKTLHKRHEVPICIINGAHGGTRIDQHQRDDANPTNTATIYGKLLWRVQQARLTHDIRAILWHQGESNQGAAGPDSGYDSEFYEQYFVDMSAGWKSDFPNFQHYYIYQIWPNACSMGGGRGDKMRDVLRKLPHLYSNMDIMTTHGITPPGGCHFPLEGWSFFASMIQPLIDRDIYGIKPRSILTPPDLRKATLNDLSTDVISLEFDQPIVWKDELISEFYLDGQSDVVASGQANGRVLTLKLKEPTAAKQITYLKETRWSQDRLLVGENGIAALTFENVDIK